MINQTFFHLAANYSASVTNGVANFDLPAVNDDIFTRNTANHFILPEPGRLRAGVYYGTTAQRCRINTPVLRYVGLPYFAPVNLGVVAASPPNVWNAGEYGPAIPKADEIAIEVTQGAGAGEPGFVFSWFSFGRQEIPGGQEYRLRFTGAITGVTGAWVSGSLTPDATLPAGIYAITGLDVQGTNLLAARLIFAGGGWRPGCLARNTLAQVPHPMFTNGELGVYGQFDSVNLPNLQILVSGANTAQEIYMDVVRRSDR